MPLMRCPHCSAMVPDKDWLPHFEWKHPFRIAEMAPERPPERRQPPRAVEPSIHLRVPPFMRPRRKR